MALQSNAGLTDRIWVLVGTRPEVIKQIPLYWALQKEFGAKHVALVGTGQHRELLDQSLRHFETELDHDLSVMRVGSSLSSLGGRILTEFSSILSRVRPAAVVVQGDTLSAAMTGMACFLEKIFLIHNEAGLRSHDLSQPFPEEGNRRLLSAIANLHLAPTELAARALQNEGIGEDQVETVGNTVVDALLWTLGRPCASPRLQEWRRRCENGRKLVLVTSHRRENANAMSEWYRVLSSFLNEHEDVDLVCPVHPNNLSLEATKQNLSSNSRVYIVEPMDYLLTCHVLKSCHMVVTDSGGIQEECASLGVPVVVCRKKTERMEAIEVGISRLADPENPGLMAETLEWAYRKGRCETAWPYGCGDAGARGAAAIRRHLGEVPSCGHDDAGERGATVIRRHLGEILS